MNSASLDIEKYINLYDLGHLVLSMYHCLVLQR